MGDERVTRLREVVADACWQTLPEGERGALARILRGRPVTYPFVWFWRKRLGERKGQRCRVVARARPSAGYGKTTVLLEFVDGFLVTTSGMGLRRAPR